MGMAPAQFGFNHPVFFGYPQMYPGFVSTGRTVTLQVVEIGVICDN
jgi:hypothetical protein